MPSYAEEHGIKRHPVQESELRAKNKQLERQLIVLMLLLTKI